MRQILVDYARVKHRQKPGGDDIQVTLREASIAGVNETPDILDVETDGGVTH